VIKMRIKIILILSVISQIAIADCDFIIINYTDYPTTAKVGLFTSLNNPIESTVKVKPNTTSMNRIKSDYNCTDSNQLGMGLAYIRFPNDPNGAGANYSPEKSSINLTGKSTGEKSGIPLLSDNGMPLWLSATGRAIDNKSFEVKLNFVKRPNSFSAGTD